MGACGGFPYLAAVLAVREAVWFKKHGALFAGFDRFGLLVGPLDIFLLMAIPADLFDSVIDNLLENAYVKRRAETGIGITVILQSEEGGMCMTVCDQGSAIATARANELFKQPVLSYSGLGIGLYQAGKQAALSGYTLALSASLAGYVSRCPPRLQPGAKSQGLTAMNPLRLDLKPCFPRPPW